MENIAAIQAKIDALEKKKKEIMKAETELVGKIVSEVFRKELAGKSKKEMTAFFKEVREIYLLKKASDAKVDVASVSPNTNAVLGGEDHE